MTLYQEWSVHYFLLLFCNFFLLIGCERRDNSRSPEDLNAIKRDFLLSVAEGEIDASPFHMNYSLTTIFFSPEIISLFGVIGVYDHLPHGWCKYEGKTLCKVDGRFKEIALRDIFSTANQQEFLRKYCEERLRSQSCSYFSGSSPLRDALAFDDIRTFVVDDKGLILLFQPYAVGGLADGPFHVRIPYGQLKDEWVSSNPFVQQLLGVISSQNYTASWDYE